MCSNIENQYSCCAKKAERKYLEVNQMVSNLRAYLIPNRPVLTLLAEAHRLISQDTADHRDAQSHAARIMTLGCLIWGMDAWQEARQIANNESPLDISVWRVHYQQQYGQPDDGVLYRAQGQRLIARAVAETGDVDQELADVMQFCFGDGQPEVGRVIEGVKRTQS